MLKLRIRGEQKGEWLVSIRYTRKLTAAKFVFIILKAIQELGKWEIWNSTSFIGSEKQALIYVIIINELIARSIRMDNEEANMRRGIGKEKFKEKTKQNTVCKDYLFSRNHKIPNSSCDNILFFLRLSKLNSIKTNLELTSMYAFSWLLPEATMMRAHHKLVWTGATDFFRKPVRECSYVLIIKRCIWQASVVRRRLLLSDSLHCWNTGKWLKISHFLVAINGRLTLFNFAQARILQHLSWRRDEWVFTFTTFHYWVRRIPRSMKDKEFAKVSDFFQKCRPVDKFARIYEH